VYRTWCLRDWRDKRPLLDRCIQDAPSIRRVEPLWSTDTVQPNYYY